MVSSTKHAQWRSVPEKLFISTSASSQSWISFFNSSALLTSPFYHPGEISRLTHDTALALRLGDRSRAFANITEIAALDPHAVESLQTDKLFTSMRPEVDQLLTRLATAARMNPDAPASPASAAGTPESRDHASLPAPPIKPETLLHVAHRLFDAGGYANYVRSADLAQSIVNPLVYSPFLAQYADKPQPGSARLGSSRLDDELRPKLPVLATAHKTWTALRTAASPRLQTLWRRAPLLVMLLGWLGIGLVAGPAAILLRTLAPESWPASLIDFGFETWGLGFLALVCFGFYARIRHLRS